MPPGSTAGGGPLALNTSTPKFLKNIIHNLVFYFNTIPDNSFNILLEYNTHREISRTPPP